MKRIKLFLIICGITICACGCDQNSNKGFSENSSEKDTIISIFGEYTSIKGTGIVQINEKEDEYDSISYILSFSKSSIIRKL